MRTTTLSLSACTLLLVLVRQTEGPASLRGFGARASKLERDWEAQLAVLASPDTIRATMRRLSARPHHVGSPYDQANAEWMVLRFRSWGWQANIEKFDVLFPTPRERVVELVAPRTFVARLSEPAVPGDSTSAQQSEQLPPYNAYSIDGDVTAPLVYVNYGVPRDYETLDSLGVSVKGAVVIARYGKSWRGIKPKVAGEHGAVGCLIYSDPREDGYQAGDVFPEGPWRPESGVQRGSVMDMPLYPGDPLTPGVGATAGAKRLPLANAQTLTRIPVLPISYGDAQPLLAALRGPTAPRGWRGGLGITYHIGPGPARVHLRVRSDWNTRTLYDVIARIPGSDAAAEWVVRGNHHDAWVNGAADPISGQAALLEEARALGSLLQRGWHPRRTIVYAAWDGEEPGLIGSTEWVETHADELTTHAVAYLNSDTNGRGFLFAGGSHSLERFINDVARDIEDPETKLSVWTREQRRRIAQADGPDARREVRERTDLSIEALGSGSDYTPFLQHLGIASLNIGFGGENDGGVYHSAYDDYFWYSHFDDSSFVYGRALAQTMGTAVMRLADAEVLPFEFTRLAETTRRFAGELRDLWRQEDEHARERSLQLEEGVFRAVADPRQPFVPPPAESEPPHLNFAPLDNALDALARSGARYERALTAAASDSGAALARPEAQAANALLLRSERALTSPAGLPGRPWFRHLLYAPGRYTGYGVKTLPGVREAIEQHRWQEADDQITAAGRALAATALVIDSAATSLERVATR